MIIEKENKMVELRINRKTGETSERVLSQEETEEILLQKRVDEIADDFSITDEEKIEALLDLGLEMDEMVGYLI